MSYIVDEAIVDALDRDAARRVPEREHALHADGRVITAQDVMRWCSEASKTQEICEVALRELIREHGAGPVVEALHAIGIFHDNRWEELAHG